MIINIIIFSLWVWAFEGNLHLSGCGIVALIFINKKKNKVKITITGKWHCPFFYRAEEFKLLEFFWEHVSREITEMPSSRLTLSMNSIEIEGKE